VASLSEAERVLFERLAAHKVPYVLLRLVTSNCFGPPYDDHLRALVGADNARVHGEAGQWVLYLGSYGPHGYQLGPWWGWVEIFQQALELVESGAVGVVPLTREELGIVDKPKALPAALRAPVKRVAWRSLF